MNEQPSLIRRLDRTGVPLLIARLIVGGMFIYLGYMKWTDPVNFLKVLRLYDMLPETPPHLLNGIAIALPYVEILCGLALIFGFAMRGAAGLLIVMLLAFYPPLIIRASEIAAEKNLAFCAVSFDCGCGTGAVNICRKLAENTILLLLSFVVLFSHSRRFTLVGGNKRPPFWFRRGQCKRCGGRLDRKAGGTCPECEAVTGKTRRAPARS